VIGDEPAGLWLLGRLHRMTQGKARLGWVSFTTFPPATAIPQAVAQAYDIALTETWSPEILIPGESFVWDERHLRARFPELAFEKLYAGALEPSRAIFKLAGETLRRYPELLGFSQGLWKSFGRSSSPEPERALLGALLATRAGWWNPAATLDMAIKRVHLTLGMQVLENIRVLKQGLLALHLRNYEALVAKKIVFNFSRHDLTRLFGSAEAMRLLNLDERLVADRALYPFRLIVDMKALPPGLSPLSVYFDTENIPDPDSELWPLWRRDGDEAAELTLWTTAGRQTSLEALQAKFREGMSRLNRLFPFLSRSIVEFKVPLGMETCFSPAARQAVTETLENEAEELYPLTWLQTAGKLKNLFVVGPFSQCHLSYPHGPLAAAETLLKQIVEKPKKGAEYERAEPTTAAH